MTSTSPYKSKLFNFLNRKSIQFNTRLTQAARRLKITVEWGTQIAVYPLYMLVQSARVATRQLAASRAAKKQEQQAITAENEITNASDLAGELIALGAEQSGDIQLQGIACSLESKDIFFVDQQNELVTPDKSQESLKKQITLHLANLNYAKRQRQEASLPSANPRILPPVQATNPTLLPPVRWVLQGISWLEQSPVAIAIDLFGESTWRMAIMPMEIYAPKLFPPLPLEPILNPIDTQVAAIEAKLLPPQLPGASDVPSLKTLMSRFRPTPPVELATPPENKQSVDQKPQKIILPPLQTFFKNLWLQTSDAALYEVDTPDTVEPKANNESGRSPKDLWLAWRGFIPGGPLPPEVAVEDVAAIIPAKPEPISALTPTAEVAPKVVNILKTPIQLEPSSEAEADVIELIIPQKMVESELVVLDVESSGEKPPEAQREKLAPQSEYLETQVLSVGYEQHFLERILKKVDQIMAWVEESIAKIWTRFSR